MYTKISRAVDHCGVEIGSRAVATSHTSSVRQAFLSEARLRCTVQLLCSGLIVAALFRKTGQRCAMEALPLRLNLAGVLSLDASPSYSAGLEFELTGVAQSVELA